MTQSLGNLIPLDDCFVKTERIIIPVSLPMKRALEHTARQNHITVAQVVRSSIFHYTMTEYPEFSEAHVSCASALLSRDTNSKGKK